MSAPLIRILSDIHYGDRGSRVDRLEQLRPLLAGVTHLVLNGDTLDTRPGPHPAHTRECADTVRDFFARETPHTTFLTGNHDADFSPVHHLDLADGRAFAIHGDIFFDDIVPWSRDAALIRRRIAAELQGIPSLLHHNLDQRMAVFRRVAASIPQRHQSEKHHLKYHLSVLADTVWPPLRIFRILRAWRDTSRNAAAFVGHHRPDARFVIAGHTHRPGIWPVGRNLTVINTGSFALALGALAVDLTPARLTVRKVEARGGEFHPGATLAAFELP